mgnify:CR=1 FL=1
MIIKEFRNEIPVVKWLPATRKNDWQQMSIKTTALLEERLGKVSLCPGGPVVAGTVGQWVLTYTVGSYGVDEGGTIKLAQRFASDWQVPQFDRPGEPGYTTVVTDGAAKLAARYDAKAHERPWMKCLVIDVYDGSLAPGDRVTITLGDQSGGSPGIRAQSFQESAHEFRVLVDPTNACVARRVPSSPIDPIVADQPVELVVVVPTQTVVNQPTRIFVKGQDRWGNPTESPDDVSLQWQGEANATIDDLNLTFVVGGQTGRVIACWNGVDYPSNPITVTDNEPPLKKYWGDLHAQSDATVGTGTEVEYFAFGRDQAALDFMSHQGNDFQMTDEDWRRLNDVVCQFHEDGRFVVFPGYEWSANTPAGGDRNVFYLDEGLPMYRSSHWQIADTPEDEFTPAHPADQLFRRLRENVDTSKVLLASHVGGRYADIRRYFDEELGPLVELVSCWGVFEWMLWDALDKGYKVGVMCNSDGHKGRPGAEGPGAGEFGICSGLTCVLAESLTREAIFTALKTRRCYGTTGPRIDLSFQVNGEQMGSCIDRSDRCQVVASVRGTTPLDSLLLYRGNQVVQSVRPIEFHDCGDSRRVRIMWGGARMRGRGRRAVWDGTIEVQGAGIDAAEPVSFDSPADGIDEVAESIVQFRSRTTGDLDGIDLWLDQAQSGSVRFRSESGELTVDLADLDAQGRRADFGGLDLHVCIVRYPEMIDARELTMSCEVEAFQQGVTPLYVKAIQADGHMAWSSPVYVAEENAAPV